MKQKAFFITFEGLSMKQITQIFLEGEIPTLILSVLRLNWFTTEIRELAFVTFR